MKIDLQQLGKDSFKNRSKIKPDEMVSCYYCQTAYLGKYILEWTGDDTAICPCGVDSVVPYELDKETLLAACKHWFGGDTTYPDYSEDVKNIPGVNFIKE